MSNEEIEICSAELREFKEQKAQIEEALLKCDASSESHNSLVALLDDIVEAIKLCEEKLLSLSKRNLLRRVDEIQTNQIEQRCKDQLESVKYSLIGQECSVNRILANGWPILQNAIISDVFPIIISKISFGNNKNIYNDQIHDDDHNSPNQFFDKEETSETISTAKVGEECSLKVRVLLCNPTCASEIPCDEFLSASSLSSSSSSSTSLSSSQSRNRSEEEESRRHGLDCRFSHGLIVDQSDLREFQMPDYTKLFAGMAMLVLISSKKQRHQPQSQSEEAENETGERAAFRQSGDQPLDIWHPARLVSFEEDEARAGVSSIVVRLENSIGSLLNIDSSEMQRVVPLPRIPLRRQLDDDNNDSKEDSEKLDEIDVSEINDPYSVSRESVRRLMPLSAASSSRGTKRNAPPQIGEWERHTNGFGSRMLRKMGYEEGRGLGSANQGRLEPVPIAQTPALKRQPRPGIGSSTISDAKKPRQQKQHTNNTATSSSPTSSHSFMSKSSFVQDLIGAPLQQKTNTKKGNKNNCKNSGENTRNTAENERAIYPVLTKSMLKGKSEIELNVKLMDLHKQMRVCEAKMRECRDEFLRTQNKPALQSHLTHFSANLAALKRSEQSINSYIQEMKFLPKSSSKKLSIF